MKKSTFLNEDALVEKAIKILMDNLGPIETARFVAMPTEVRTESVKRHRDWQSQLDKDDFFELVFGSK
jgi:hypothetical protein